MLLMIFLWMFLVMVMLPVEMVKLFMSMMC
jgi:hypothetical protein